MVYLNMDIYNILIAHESDRKLCRMKEQSAFDATSIQCKVVIYDIYALGTHIKKSLITQCPANQKGKVADCWEEMVRV